MAGWLLRNLTEPNIGKYLLREEGEVIVDVVRRHWVVYIRPALEALGSAALFGVALYTSVEAAWLPMILGIAVLLHAVGLALRENMDRFVITDKRVFRVTGVLNRTFATMPLKRILDIAMEQPISGRLSGYAHFVFESAAQEQGLREIRYVGAPAERQRTIQRLVQ